MLRNLMFRQKKGFFHEKKRVTLANIRKPLLFCVSGGIERDQWQEMAKASIFKPDKITESYNQIRG